MTAVPGPFQLLRWGIARYAVGDLVPVRSERAGFAGGARWMARAMGRPVDAAGVKAAARAGLVKYGVALGFGVACAAIACRIHWSFGAAVFVLAFYAAEVQGLFLVPLAVRGAPLPLAASRALVVRGGGTLAALVRVLPIAAWMIVGAPFRGLARSWCEGCLAVLRWLAAVEGRTDA